MKEIAASWKDRYFLGGLKMPILQTEKLSKSYRGIQGISDLDLQMEKGEFLSLIGPRNAGKTTLVHILLNYIRPDSGWAKIFDEDVTRRSYEIKKRVGYAPAKANFYRNMRAEDILSMAASMKNVQDEEETDGLCQQLKIDYNLKVWQMPLGQKKKLSLIQALMGSPELLILDEPLLGFDEEAKEVFWRLMKREKEKGTAVLYCSRREEGQFISDHTVYLYQGKRVPEEQAGGRTIAHRIRIRTKEDISAVLQVLSASDVELSEGYLSFYTQAEMDSIIKALANCHIEDLKIELPYMADVMRHRQEERAEHLVQKS